MQDLVGGDNNRTQWVFGALITVSHEQIPSHGTDHGDFK
jgi:hypothetical protein